MGSTGGLGGMSIQEAAAALGNAAAGTVHQRLRDALMATQQQVMGQQAAWQQAMGSSWQTTTTATTVPPWPVGAIAPGTVVQYPVPPGSWTNISTYASPPLIPPITITPEELAEMSKEGFDMIQAASFTGPTGATAHCTICSALIIWVERGWRKHRANCMMPLPPTDVDGI